MIFPVSYLLIFFQEYEKQWELFKIQFQLAIEYKRPISIHCVHAITELFDFLIKQKEFPPAISFHSFGTLLIPFQKSI